MKKLMLLLVVLVAASCNHRGKRNQKQTTEGLFKINIENAYKETAPLLLSTFADDIDYIPLEFHPDFPIKDIYDIKLTNDYIFTSDYYNVYQFSRQGKFIRQIGEPGRGPGEYLGIRCIVLDHKKNHILIGSQKKVIKYNFDGSFIDEFSTSLEPLHLVQINDDKLAFYYPDFPRDEIDYGVFITDNKGFKQKEFPRTNRIKTHDTKYIPYRGIHKIFDNVRLLDLHGDTIFTVTENILLPYLVIDYGKFKYDKHLAYTDPSNSEKFKNSILALRMVETDKVILFQFSHGHYTSTFAGIFFKKTNTFRFDSGAKLEAFSQNIKRYNAFSSYDIANVITNDIDGGYPFFPIDYDEQTKCLIISYTPYLLKNYIKSEEFQSSKPTNPEKKASFVDMVNSLTIDGNPVIGLIKSKS